MCNKCLVVLILITQNSREQKNTNEQNIKKWIGHKTNCIILLFRTHILCEAGVL